jgi:hypothetical protein
LAQGWGTAWARRGGSARLCVGGPLTHGPLAKHRTEIHGSGEVPDGRRTHQTDLSSQPRTPRGSLRPGPG